MGHVISWDNKEKTVVLQEYVDPAVKDDLYHLAQESAQMLHTVGHTVHLIIDERNVSFTLTSADMGYLERLTPYNQGAVVVIVPASRIPYKNIVQVLGQKIGPNAFTQPYFAQTIEEARAFLQDNFGVSYSAEVL